jgi:outer membrane protein assembly factor BamB
VDGVAYLAGPGGLSAINTATGEKIWNYGYLNPADVNNSVTFYSSPVVYDVSTKMPTYPASSGNKQ